MGQVLELTEFRERRDALQRRQAPAEVYYCNRCAQDEFRLSPQGRVHCAHCGALMRNIFVGPASPGQRGR